MLLNLEQFTTAASAVDRIITADVVSDLSNEIRNSAVGIDDPRTRREFFRHMNTLFLNVLLNRLNDVGLDREARILQARQILVQLINA